jgi:hypothetical protein
MSIYFMFNIASGQMPCHYMFYSVPPIFDISVRGVLAVGNSAHINMLEPKTIVLKNKYFISLKIRRNTIYNVVGHSDKWRPYGC